MIIRRRRNDKDNDHDNEVKDMLSYLITSLNLCYHILIVVSNFRPPEECQRHRDHNFPQLRI